MSDTFEIRRMTKADFDAIVVDLDRWWGGPATAFAHPIFIHELGEHALVAEQGDAVIGFLLGFIAPRSESHPPTGYIHLVGIDPDHRRKGIGKSLYLAFAERAKRAGATRLKAITSVGNKGSLRFHEALSFDVREDADYSGPGYARIVFTKPLG